MQYSGGNRVSTFTDLKLDLLLYLTSYFMLRRALKFLPPLQKTKLFHRQGPLHNPPPRSGDAARSTYGIPFPSDLCIVPLRNQRGVLTPVRP